MLETGHQTRHWRRLPLGLREEPAIVPGRYNRGGRRPHERYFGVSVGSNSSLHWKLPRVHSDQSTGNDSFAGAEGAGWPSGTVGEAVGRPVA